MKDFAIYLYGPDQGPLPLDFETLAERLEGIPRLYFEYDGSWVWSGDDETLGAWQLDGMAYDAAGKVQYIDIKGRCPVSIWDMLLRLLGSYNDVREQKFGHDDERKVTSIPQDWCVLKLPEQELLGLQEFHQETWFSSE